MEKNTNSRRDFVKKTLLASAAVTVGGVLPGFSASSYRRIKGANDRFTIGVMGVNSRGAALASTFASQANCTVGFISDVDSRASAKCIARVSKIQSSTPKSIPDFRNTLQQKDLDVMVIATPDHWHAPAALLALQADKHVYREKPGSQNPREGERVMAGQ